MIAEAVQDQLLRWGVREVVLAAGARNLPLAVAAFRRENLRCWNHFEERSAGYFALGRIRATGLPVAVITTSGTAVANLLPPMIEAHYQGLPLLAVTADRPPDFRGTGAPQAIEQRAIFGRYADWFDLTDAEGLGMLPEFAPTAPYHLNVCLEEPTAAELGRISTSDTTPNRVPAMFSVVEDCSDLDDFVLQGEAGETLMVVGPLTPEQGAAVAPMLETYRRPVLAEAISNLPYSKRLEDLLIREDEVTLSKTQRVLRIGGVPTARLWRDLEVYPQIAVAHLTNGEFTGLARGGDILGALPKNVGEPISAEVEFGDGLDVSEFPESEVGLVAALAKAIPVGAMVFLGNSLPVREWSRVFPLGKHRCYANRGANGIDGNLSTFLGLAEQEGEQEAWAVVGDLTALYDLAGPFVLRQVSSGVRLRVVVLNNSGGRIFSRLPSLEGLAEEEQASVENSHELEFSSVASLWGLHYRRFETAAEFSEHGEAQAGKRFEFWELVPNDEQTEGFWQSLSS